MKIAEALEKRIRKQHILGCKVALIVNIIWAILNCIIIKDDLCSYATANLVVAMIIGATLLYNRKKALSGSFLGLVPMLTTLTAFAYIYNTLELEVFQKISYVNVAVYIGAGMFLLWRIKYSFISLFYAFIINAIMYTAFSPLHILDYMFNGGFMMLIVGVFMVVSIQIRYNLTKRELTIREILKKSEKEMKISEEQHRLLFEKNPTPMLICSMETLRIIAVNDFVIEKYGYSRDEFMSMKITDLHNKIDIKDVIICAEKAQGNFDKLTKWVHVLKDETKIDVELVAKSIEYNGMKARLVSISDVTEVNKYQNELIKAKEQAVNAKKLLGQFLSNMSHEIRTPMNGIMGITRVLQKTELNEEQRRYLNVVNKSSENLMMIINDILDFSKIEAGKIELEEMDFNLDELISVVQEIMVTNAEEKGIYLTVEKDPESPTWIKGDPVRLNQILTNLVSNGIKFTEKGGVKIKVGSQTVSNDRVRLNFTIKDSGIGIPKDKCKTIFKSFTQASSSTTRTHGGTGLGLTITKQLIELQNGIIWIESEPGHGSEFNFQIDYNLAENPKDNIEYEMRQKEVSDERILAELEGLKILLVEDHPINQMLAMKVLGDWGFNVDLAENGKVALDIIGQKSYNLVLMDISMPEMDGYEATKGIRSGKYNDNPEIPIIAMTASALIGENQKCFKSGMNDYVSKPFDPDYLLDRIAYHTLTNIKHKRA